MARVVIASLALSLIGIPAFAQDPQDVLNRLIRQQQIEQQQRFEDQQRQRQLDQQEADYDRQMCLKAGYIGPDVEQCVRDSAAWRRGVRPSEPDFAAYGTPASGTPQSAGLAHITVCAIVAKPSKFDNRGVRLDGIITDLYETTSQRGNELIDIRFNELLQRITTAISSAFGATRAPWVLVRGSKAFG